MRIQRTLGARRTPGRRSHRARRAVATALVAAITFAACDGDDATGVDVGAGDDVEAVPAPGVTRFAEGDFDGLPVPRGATEIGTRTELDGAVAQSFTVTATSPQQIMDFYDGQLAVDGWDVVEPVRETGIDSVRGAWERDGRRLEVSSTLAQGVEDERSQFSLVLLPSTAAGGVLDDGG